MTRNAWERALLHAFCGRVLQDSWYPARAIARRQIVLLALLWAKTQSDTDLKTRNVGRATLSAIRQAQSQIGSLYGDDWL